MTLYRYGEKELGFTLGEPVQWISSDSTIALNDVGVVIGPRAEDDKKDQVRVRFLGGLWCFDAGEFRPEV